MHGAIRNRLEELLRPARAANEHTDVVSHLSECGRCASELDVMRTQAEMLKTLKGPEDLEVPATFYAGVMRLIEENRKASIWSALIYSPFSTRFVYASLALALLVSSFLVTQEGRDGHLTSPALMARNTHYDAPVFGDQDQQRDAVLTNFASH